MKKELLISLLALLVALLTAIGVWHRGPTVAFANSTEGPGGVSGINYLASSTEPGAWIVAGNSLYLVRADYDFNNKQWTIRQLASIQLTAR